MLKKEISSMMIRKQIFIIITFLIFISACSNRNSSKLAESKNIMQFALYNDVPDIYPERLFQYFKNHGIKTVSFVSQDLETNKLDSLEYLVLDSSGKLITRTTKECTTIGCLPYMNRQEYLYSENNIKRIDVFVFKNKNRSVLSEWSNPDTSEYYKFDWNTYSYKDDTVFVETGIALYKYMKDNNDNIIYREMRVKSSNQIVYSNISYTDSTVIFKSKFNFGDTTLIYNYRIKGNRVEERSMNNKNSKLIKEWIYDANGLINEINVYKNNKIISKTYLTYTFFT